MEGGTGNVGLLRADIANAESMIQNELRIKTFLYVPPEEAIYYENQAVDSLDDGDYKPLFGQLVHDRFGKAEHDIREAGNCLALDRHTACVFHLMRTIERGVDALRIAVGAPAPNSAKPNTKGWGAQAGQIRDHVQAFDAGTITGPTWLSANRAFLDKTRAQIEGLKNAYRDPIAHPEHFSDGAEARRVFDLTHGLMGLLATCIDEDGNWLGP